MKFTGSGTGQCLLHQYVPVNLVKGRWVTAAVRIFVPIGQAADVGRLALADSAGSVLHAADTNPQGAFRWAVVTKFVPATATNCRLLLYVDATSGGTGNCTVDRASLVVGKFPMQGG